MDLTLFDPKAASSRWLQVLMIDMSCWPATMPWSSDWQRRGFHPRCVKKSSCGAWSAAVGLRIVMAVVAVKLLAVIGLTLAGGILLLWVCWRIWRDIRRRQQGA